MNIFICTMCICMANLFFPGFLGEGGSVRCWDSGADSKKESFPGTESALSIFLFDHFAKFETCAKRLVINAA